MADIISDAVVTILREDMIPIQCSNAIVHSTSGVCLGGITNVSGKFLVVYLILPTFEHVAFA